MTLKRPMRALREEPAGGLLSGYPFTGWFSALVLHLVIMILVVLSRQSPDTFTVPDPIIVDLIALPQETRPEDAIEVEKPSPPLGVPFVRPRLKPIRKPERLRETDIEASNNSETREASTSDVTVAVPKSTIPSRWALEPPLAKERLEGLGLLGDDINCLRSLSDDCKALREELFSDYALSEYEKLIAANTPWSGLGSEFYGLSEQEILEKLNVPIAGQNGLTLPLVGTIIDGPLWDRMHGVNKPCKLRPGYAGVGSSQSGRLTVIRDCERKDD